MSRAVLFALIGCLPSFTFAGTIFFTDKDAARLHRVSTDGGPLATLLTNANGLLDPRGVGVDPAAGKLYFGDNLAQKIWRSNLDGTGREDLITATTIGISDLTLDLANGHMYWADRDGNAIRRANLNGTNPVVVRPDVAAPYFLTLDVPNGLVYWSDFQNTTVHRAKLDGTGSVENFVTGLTRARDMVLDPAGGWLYYADRDAKTIARKRLDVTGTIQPLFDITDGLNRPHGLAIDPAEGFLYWTDTDAHTLSKGRLDGIGLPVTLASSADGLIGPWGIAIAVPEPGVVLLPVLSTVALAKRARRGRTTH
jgi:sugar lactone lactonase YvrE